MKINFENNFLELKWNLFPLRRLHRIWGKGFSVIQFFTSALTYKILAGRYLKKASYKAELYKTDRKTFPIIQISEKNMTKKEDLVGAYKKPRKKKIKALV